MLYLIPTPIGNLEDITYRAISVLKEVDLILAEDTRQSKKLTSHYMIDTAIQSYHAHNEHHKLEYYISQLKIGTRIALISDAGSPGISDPGFLLVRECRDNEIAVVPLPGPTAFVPAVTASGIPCDKFFFEGFLPQKKGRQTRLQYITALPTTVVLYESPYRLLKCLDQLKEHCGEERIVCVARELTKIHEDIKRGTVQELIEYYKSKPSIKGEIVIILSGKESEK